MPIPGAALDGLTVLVIEDEYLIASDVQRMVEDAGAAQVLLAGSTATALACLADPHQIDVCILDLKLGDEDGRPLAQELLTRGIPFVVATGMGIEADLPGVPIVHKPYTDTQVVDALRRARQAR
jgi:CheY-like chemotaxis protein